MKMTKKRKSSKVFTVLALVMALLCVAVWLPRFFGLEAHYVKTGSMEPNIPEGSMVYTEAIKFEDIVPGADVLLFSNDAENKSFTHRVMYIDYKNELLYTKGDANNGPDPLPTPFEQCRGKVSLYIPYWGYVVQAMNSAVGKVVISLIYIVWLAVEIEGCKSRKKAVK